MSKSPRQAAAVIQKHYKLTKPTLDELVGVISEQGYEIIDFEPKSETMTALSEELALTPAIVGQSAFLYRRDGISLLFVKSSLTGQEKLYALAHELGHIVLGHTQTGGVSSVTEEYEAAEFMHYVLNPGMWRRVSLVLYHHRLAAVAIISVLALAVVGIGFAQRQAYESRFNGDYYVTPSGKKYHRRECSVLKDRSNIRRIAEDEMEVYDPCKLCLPDLQ